VPPTQKHFHFLSSKSLVLVNFSAIFVKSSSTTDELLRNDLSGGGPSCGGHGPPVPPKSGSG